MNRSDAAASDVDRPLTRRGGRDADGSARRYRAGKVGPNDMSVFDEAEPTKKHWSRRIHTLERIADRVPITNRYPAYRRPSRKYESRRFPVLLQ